MKGVCGPILPILPGGRVKALPQGCEELRSFRSSSDRCPVSTARLIQCAEALDLGRGKKHTEFGFWHRFWQQGGALQPYRAVERSALTRYAYIDGMFFPLMNGQFDAHLPQAGTLRRISRCASRAPADTSTANS